MSVFISDKDTAKLYVQFLRSCTVEPPLLATSPQRPLYFVPADSPHFRLI